MSQMRHAISLLGERCFRKCPGHCDNYDTKPGLSLLVTGFFKIEGVDAER